MSEPAGHFDDRLRLDGRLLSDWGEEMAPRLGFTLTAHASHTRTAFRCLAVSVLLVLLSVPPVLARSPLVAEVRTFSSRYHENLARLDTIREELEQAIKADPDVGDLVALAQVCFIWGDIRAVTDAQKLDAYERGRQAAKRAVEVDPRNAAAHFWYATNTGRWGQTKGVVRSLFLLPIVQEEIQIILDLDPHFTAVYALAGNVFYEVPGFLGGDLNKAEQMFRKGLEQDPKFTGMRLGLAKTLIKKGQIEEARPELQAVLDEKEPRNLADWVTKDARRARELLESIR